MEPMGMNHGDEGRGGDNQSSDAGREGQFKRRGGDRRGEGGLFGGYDGPERRSGIDRRAND